MARSINLPQTDGAEERRSGYFCEAFACPRMASAESEISISKMLGAHDPHSLRAHSGFNGGFFSRLAVLRATTMAINSSVGS